MPITNYPNGVSSYGVPVLPSNVGAPNGNVFIVDSGDAANGDIGSYGTAEHPFATLDYAVGQCSANNGDVIHVLPGHAETVSAAAGLDLDVAGITIVFHGEGNARGSITFDTAVGADMDVDAADITLINARFVAGIDALTGPIDVNAARFRMIDCTWQEADSINTTDCVVADANADDLYIENFEFVDADAAGTQKQSFIQIAAATRPVLKGIKCTGDFATGIIENGTAWIDAYLEDLVLDNANSSPTVCLLLQGTSTGWVRNSSLRVASGSTGYTATNDMQFDNVNVIGTDAASAGSSAVGSVTDAAATGAVTTTDTLMAYVKQLVTQNGIELDTDTLGSILVGTSGVATYPAAAAPANGVSLAEVLRIIYDRQLGDGTDASANTRLGSRVTRAAADIIDGTTTAVFTVSGTVLLTGLTGLVSGAALDAGASNLKFQSNPTTGSTTDLCANLDVDSDEIGTMYSIDGAPATALLRGESGNVQVMPNGPVQVAAGSIEIVSAADSGSGGGLLALTAWYIPLTDGASIVSA